MLPPTLRHALIVGALGLTCVLPLHAADDEAKKMSPAAELLELMSFEANALSAARAGFDPAVQQFRDQGMPDAAIEEIQAAADRFFTKTFSDPALKQGLIDLYAESFTDDELHELIAFYNTRVGRKSLILIPDITNKAMAQGQKFAEKNSAQFQQEMAEIIQRYQAMENEAEPGDE